MKMKVGDYLLSQLKQFGIKQMFGVPGDYILGFLDLVENDKDIEWIGNCNELNASYAADGYARVHGISSLAITYGVGELSAINGVAGSFAEGVPVVVISGRPSTQTVETKALVHHSLGTGAFEMFHEMFSKVTGAQTILTARNAQKEIERVLNICYKEKTPVYIELASDLAKQEIEIVSETEFAPFSTNLGSLRAFKEDVEKRLISSKGQVIIADYLVDRFQLENELSTFINNVKLPAMTLSMAKGLIHEDSPYFPGTYAGIFSNENIKEIALASDLAIVIGAKFTDDTTGGFKMINPSIVKITINPFFCEIEGKVYDNILMKDAMRELAKLSFKNSIPVKKETVEKFVPIENAKLTQDRLYKAVESYLTPSNIILGETGTAYFGLSEITLPKGTKFIGQPLWGSIGYTGAAVLGSSIADRTRRNIVMIGDGSFQLTAQEISTIMRNKLNTIVMLLNNDGYTIEKVIHGYAKKYNDVSMWRYSKLPQVLTTDDSRWVSVEVRTEKDLIDAFEICDKNQDKMVFIELFLETYDVPKSLKEEAQVFKDEDKF